MKFESSRLQARMGRSARRTLGLLAGVFFAWQSGVSLVPAAEAATCREMDTASQRCAGAWEYKPFNRVPCDDFLQTEACKTAEAYGLAITDYEEKDVANTCNVPTGYTTVEVRGKYASGRQWCSSAANGGDCDGRYANNSLPAPEYSWSTDCGAEQGKAIDAWKAANPGRQDNTLSPILWSTRTNCPTDRRPLRVFLDSTWIYAGNGGGTSPVGSYYKRIDEYGQGFIDNVVTGWAPQQNATRCGTHKEDDMTRPIYSCRHPNHPDVDPSVCGYQSGVRYSSPMKTLAAVQAADLQAEIRTSSAHPPVCTTGDFLPESTQAEVQSKYTTVSAKLNDAAWVTHYASLTGITEPETRKLLVSTLTRLYEHRGELLSATQRAEAEAFYGPTQYPAFRSINRVEPSVNYSWTGAPFSPLKADYFSAEWTGVIIPRYTEDYTFSTLSDDGVQLWVGDSSGPPLIDNWTYHGPTTNVSAPLLLIANTAYPIRLRYFQGSEAAVMSLSWMSASQAEEIIPQTQLFVSDAKVQPGLLASYYDNEDLTSGPLCGNTWTPPLVASTCSASQHATLDAEMAFCQRMSRDPVSTALGTMLFDRCVNQLAELVGAVDREECAMYEYQDAYLVVSGNFLSRYPPPSAVASSSSFAASGSDPYAQLEQWRANVLKLYGGADPGYAFTSRYEAIKASIDASLR